MLSPIVFRREDMESTFLDPRQAFAPRTVAFQVRVDPLTGRTGHLSHFGAIQWQPLDVGSYNRDEVKGFCPFCPDARERFTPRFPDDLMGEGRPSIGEAQLIPNLFPYDIYSAVLIMSDRHAVPLDGFDGTMLGNALSLGVDFLKRVAVLEPSLPYHLMAWNYMPPSGGGLVHPHQQYFATAHPGNVFIDEYTSSKAFQEEHGVSFWTELVAEELRQGVRHIGTTGRSEWLASFVPRGIPGDVMAIFPHVFSVRDLTASDIGDLISGLTRLFAYFRDAGMSSFNAVWSFGPAGQTFFSSHFRIIPRTFLNLRDYAPDFSFFQALLGEPVSVALPEDVCRDLRPYFTG
ncbi:MAG: hypothetical protein ABSC19_13045 [Syntrophorhabdales bacterium]|jgi:galactose-1-phosphate uridylyltransferase